MSYELLCEACGARLRMEDASARTLMECPDCSALVVPSGTAESAADGQVAAEAPASSPKVRQVLSETRMWVIFLSIVGALVGAIGVFVLGRDAMDVIEQGELPMYFVVPAYCLHALLMFGGSYWLLVYGLRIGAYRRKGSVETLEVALIAQKTFWKWVAVMMLSILGVFVAGFVAAIVWYVVMLAMRA